MLPGLTSVGALGSSADWPQVSAAAKHPIARSAPALLASVLREISGDSVIERKLHSQAWILLRYFGTHLRGALRRRDIRFPVRHVFLHPRDRREIACRARTFVAADDDRRIQRLDLRERLHPFGLVF